jgi:microcystin-dependent protein
MARQHTAVLGLTLVLAMPFASQAAVTGSTGSGEAHQNMQPSLGTNYIIALSGTYPPSGGSGGSLEPYLGEITMFAGNFAPRNWAFAHGQLLSKNQHAALFSLLGYTYGGNGSTTFALPDLRGRVPIGIGQGPGLTNRSLGQTTGSETTILTTAQMPSHSHTLPTSGTTQTTGSGATHSEMQPSLALNYIIAVNGVFPPRPGSGSGGGIDPYIGELALFAGNFAPTHWKFADGSLLNSSQYPALAAILGSTYGGNGITTFALPDLRGRAALGAGYISEQLVYDPGQNIGAESIALTTAQLPGHSHTLSSGGSTGPTGSGAAHSNMQPSLGLNYIIAMEGIYPPPAGAGGDGEADDSGSGGGELPYIGEIVLFAGPYAPEGWAFADGSLYSIDQNQALYQILGTTYGGDGVETFALPNFSGRLPMGMGQGTGLTNRLLGQQIGTESVALTAAQVPAHTHTFSESLPGDFNADGEVDAADYIAWRKGLVAQTTPNYNLWRTNFGRTLSGSGGNAPIPEPTTLALVLLISAAAATRRLQGATGSASALSA